MKQSIFQSYTFAEAEETARIWAGFAIAATAFAFMMVAQRIRDAAWYDSDLVWAAGMMNGVFAVMAIWGLVFELRAASKAVKFRKLYKKAHPELFDSAGDPKQQEGALSRRIE